MITATDIRIAASRATVAKQQFGDHSDEVAAAMDVYNKMRKLRDEQERFNIVKRDMDPGTARLHARTLALAEAQVRYGPNSFQAKQEQALYDQATRERNIEVSEEREQGMRSAAITDFFGNLGNRLRVFGGMSSVLAMAALIMIARGRVK